MEDKEKRLTLTVQGGSPRTGASVSVRAGSPASTSDVCSARGVADQAPAHVKASGPSSEEEIFARKPKLQRSPPRGRTNSLPDKWTLDAIMTRTPQTARSSSAMNTDGEEENKIIEHTRASPSPDNVRKKKRKRVETTRYQESQVQDTSQGH